MSAVHSATSRLTSASKRREAEERADGMSPTAHELRSNGVFAGLSPHHLDVVASCSIARHVAAGEHLFLEGEPADGFVLIRSGAIALELGAPGRHAIVIETLHDGEIVGWSWLFPPHRWHFDGRAIEPTDVLAFDGTFLREACESDHELGYELINGFAGCMLQRLQATRIRLMDVSGVSDGSSAGAAVPAAPV